MDFVDGSFDAFAVMLGGRFMRLIDSSLGRLGKSGLLDF